MYLTTLEILKHLAGLQWVVDFLTGRIAKPAVFPAGGCPVFLDCATCGMTSR